MTEDRLPSPGKIRQVIIDVLRCGEGDTFFLRTLSDSYGGLFTHYVSKRSQYCPGERCSCQHRKSQRVWKGYAAVEKWLEKEKVWEPAVLEITENLEHCFNGKWERGQVWKLSRRMPDSERDSYPVVGQLLEKLDLNKVPRAFDWKPVMQRKFHVLEQLESSHKNPLPRPSIAVFSLDPGPAALLAAEEPKPMTAEELQAIREKAAKIGSLYSSNGTHEKENHK